MDVKKKSEAVVVLLSSREDGEERVSDVGHSTGIYHIVELVFFWVSAVANCCEVTNLQSVPGLRIFLTYNVLCPNWIIRRGGNTSWLMCFSLSRSPRSVPVLVPRLVVTCQLVS